MRRVLLVSVLAFTALGAAAPALAAPEPFCVGGSNGTAKPIVCVNLPVHP